MADNRFPCGSGSGREAVCIETNRVLDSCRDRDCFENVRVLLTDFGRDLVERTSTVRAKGACIASAHITIDPVQFNRGFYTVNIRFYIKLLCEACVCGRPQEFDGIAVVDKSVVLYGSECNVNIFRSSTDNDGFCSTPELADCTKNSPVAVVEAVDPIILSLKVLEREEECNCCCCCRASDVPERVTYGIDGSLNDDAREHDRYLAVSMGIFSVVRIVRPAQYLVNATEYSVPDKECVPGRETDPCRLFNTMAFPTAEFNPASLNNSSGIVERRCGSCNNNCNGS